MAKIVENSRFYRIKLLLLKKEFQSDVQQLKDSFASFDLAIPVDGFKNEEEYEGWRNSYWEKWSIYAESPGIKKLTKKYTDKDGKLIRCKETEFFSVRDLKIPPVYGSEIRNIAIKHGFDKNDNDIYHFLIRHIFFNQNHYKNSSLTISQKRNIKTHKMELFLRIYPWTTKEDVINSWHLVQEEQLFYPEFKMKNKSWKMFDRDYRVFQLYQEARRLKDIGEQKGRIEDITLALLTREEISGLDPGYIKRIYTKVRNFIDKSNF